jgi:hypothetical protein
MGFDAVSIGSLFTSSVILIVGIGYVCRRIFKLNCFCFSCEQQIAPGSTDLNPISAMNSIIQDAANIRNGLMPITERNTNINNTVKNNDLNISSESNKKDLKNVEMDTV